MIFSQPLFPDEGMQSDDLKPEKIFSLASNFVQVDGTLIMHSAKNHYVTLDECNLYVNDFSCDKHEESIVWKGGLVYNLNDRGILYPMEGKGLDDFYESDPQQEEASMHGNERIDWWAATWPDAIRSKEDRVLDSSTTSSSSSLVHTDYEVQADGGSLFWSDMKLCKSIQQSVYSRAHVDTDISSMGSIRSSSMPEKEKGSSRGNVCGLKSLHKSCKSLMELDLPLSQDSFDLLPPTSPDANISEGGRPISTSINRHFQPTTGHTSKYGGGELSSCESVSKRDHTMQENVLESSRYIIDTEDLDKLVVETKCQKENMKKGMEDIYLLRQRAEQEEVVAQQAKVEATRGGLDILSKVEDLRQHVLRERVEYDMRAAEVYGERSVLALEARELRLRLLETQAEQTRALSVLDSVRSTLTTRLEKASQEKHSAEMEAKLKEECAEELLAQEEDSARTLAENFKALEAEAETCRKLREFLIDRGNVVDSLQGEMAVLCEDVLNFKKQVDEGIPLSGSRSLSWSHLSHLTEQCSSTLRSNDVRDGQSPRSSTLESSDFLKPLSNTSVLTLSSTTSGLPTSVGPIDCALQSQYFSLNTSPIDTLDVVNEQGLGGQEVAEEIVDRLVLPASVSCDDGQKQEQSEENLNPVSSSAPVV